MRTLSETIKAFGFQNVREVKVEELQLNMRINLREGFKKKAVILKTEDSYDIRYGFDNYTAKCKSDLLSMLKSFFGNLHNIQAIAAGSVILLMEVPESMIEAKKVS